MTGGRTWSWGDQWYVPPAFAGRDPNMWDLAFYDELSNGRWDEQVLEDAKKALNGPAPPALGREKTDTLAHELLAVCDALKQ